MQRYLTLGGLTVAVALVLAACGGNSSDTVSGAAASDDDVKQAEARKGGGTGGGGTGNSGVVLSAEPGVRSLTLSWNDNGASQYNVVVSSNPGCDIARYSLCADGRLFVNVRPPHRIDGLVNGRAYFARVEGVYASGRRLSNEAGARPNTVSFNAPVHAIEVAADGTTFLGGAFTMMGITSGHGVALDNSSGNPADPRFPIVSGGSIAAVAADGSGGWIIGGSFNRVGGLERKGLARIRADGSVHPSWAPTANGTVHAIAVMNGVAYIGGTFSTINGQKRTGLAAIDVANGYLTAWNPDPDLATLALATANGTIYAGGIFTQVGAFQRKHLVAIDTYANVLPWNPGADNTVRALAVANGIVYAGGFFTAVAGQPRGCLAAIDTSGNVTPWNPPLELCPSSHVRRIAVAGITVYVGGSFGRIGAAARNGLASLDTAGNVLSWDPQADGDVHALATANDGQGGVTVYAGGLFTRIGGQPRAYLAALDAQGKALPWSPTPNGAVDALAATGTAIYAGGEFTGLNASRRNYLAALDRDGAPKPWNPNADGPVLALAQGGDLLYAGGTFTTIGGQARLRLAAIDLQGNPGAWNPGADWPVRAVAVSGNTVYVGGDFYNLGGQPRNRVGAVSTNGALLPWNPNPDRTVHALAVWSTPARGDWVYLGGEFTTVGGQTRRRLAQVDAQGALLPWNPGQSGSMGSTEYVYAMRFAGDAIYVGGSFGRIGAYGRRGLAAIGIGGDVLPWSPAVNNVVWSLAVAGDNVYIGGEFTQVSNAASTETRNGLAAIGFDGTVRAWNPNAGNPGHVYSVAATSTAVHAGGYFTQVGEQVAGGFATLAP